MPYWPIYATALLAILQAGDAIDIGWWFVTAPLWFPVACVAAFIGGIAGLAAYITSLERRR